MGLYEVFDWIHNHQKLLWATIILLAIVIIVGGTFFTIGDNSNGARTGKLIKISHTGILWHTWEGELAMNAYDQSTGMYVWSFSVCDGNPDMLAFLGSHLGKEIEVDYTSSIFVPRWQSGSGYCVDTLKLQQ